MLLNLQAFENRPEWSSLIHRVVGGGRGSNRPQLEGFSAAGPRSFPHSRTCLGLVMGQSQICQQKQGSIPHLYFLTGNVLLSVGEARKQWCHLKVQMCLDWGYTHLFLVHIIYLLKHISVFHGKKLKFDIKPRPHPVTNTHALITLNPSSSLTGSPSLKSIL